MNIEHNLDVETRESLQDLGFEPKIKGFYNSRQEMGKRINFRDNVHCYSKHVKSHMGGNYGSADEYLIANSDGLHKMQYYGDGSASIKKICDIDNALETLKQS